MSPGVNSNAKLIIFKNYLIIKREPCDIDFTSGLENSWRYINTRAIATHYYICRISSIKSFVSTIVHQNVWFPYSMRWSVHHIKRIAIINKFVRTKPKLTIREYTYIRRSLTLPYSDVFHLKFISFHS